MAADCPDRGFFRSGAKEENHCMAEKKKSGGPQKPPAGRSRSAASGSHLSNTSKRPPAQGQRSTRSGQSAKGTQRKPAPSRPPVKKYKTSGTAPSAAPRPTTAIGQHPAHPAQNTRPVQGRPATGRSSVQRPAPGKPQKRTSGAAAAHNAKSSAHKPQKPVKPAVRRTKKVFGFLGKTVASLLLVFIITGCIVTAALTIYVVKFIDPEANLDLARVKSNFATTLITLDEAGAETEYTQLPSNYTRTWVDLKDVPDNMKNAFIAIEDKRFLQHEGVDWKRTFSAFANLFFNFYSSQQGGSTITQQLIKNLTGETQVRLERKVQEIIRAINLEKKYSKDIILEAYLNSIYLDNGLKGVQTASQAYYGKPVSELSLAQCASIAAITKNPYRYNPTRNPKDNKERRDLVLDYMYDQGYISKEECEQAKNEKIVTVKQSTEKKETVIESYFTDLVISDLTSDLIKQKNMTQEQAEDAIYNSGYKVYVTVSPKVQVQMENYYRDNSNFPIYSGNEHVQSAMAVLSPKGGVLGIVGGRGEKTINRGLNRAAQSKRSPGSSIKPVGVYAPAIEYDVTNYSKIEVDKPIDTVINGVKQKWPKNASGYYSGSMTVERAVRESTNTVAVRVCQRLGVDKSFDFLTQNLGITTLVKKETKNGKVISDLNLSSLALGGMEYGVTPLELAGAYVPICNGGLYIKPHTYTKVVDAYGNIVLSNDEEGAAAMSPATAQIVNRLMQNVITGSGGTGRAAAIDGVTIAGKTGTTNDNKDRWFVGMTPDYVGVVWTGYDQQKEINFGGGNPSLNTWRAVMSKVVKGEEQKEFPASDKVVEREYCTSTGLLAKSGCPKKTGYYKADSLPEIGRAHV